VAGGRWRVEVGLIGLAGLLGGMFLLDAQADEPGPHPVVLPLVVGTLAGLALPLRRRWPVGLALVLIPSILLSAAAMGATAVALLGVAATRPRWVTAAVAGLHALLIGSLFAMFAGPREFWQGLLVVLALDAAFIASGLLLRSKSLLEQSLRERAREAEEQHRSRLREARHTERERIAREMHDVLAHRISLLAVHAGALEVRRSAPADERQAAAVIREHAYAALEDLREVLGLLRRHPTTVDPATPDPDPLTTVDVDLDRPQPSLRDLPALIEQSVLAGAPITLDCPDLPPGPDAAGRHVYRIVQEALTNARKHAPGTPVRVRLVAPRKPSEVDSGEMAGLTVEVTNPLPAGTAGRRIPGAGRGLVGLRERMDLVGGRLEHGSTPEGEFRLWAWVPWR
jgi:signal transduction histidine kinase